MELWDLQAQMQTSITFGSNIFMLNKDNLLINKWQWMWIYISDCSAECSSPALKGSEHKHLRGKY